jgi:hypothetical protein
MNADDRLQAWLAHRRSQSLPENFADRIMASLDREEVSERTSGSLRKACDPRLLSQNPPGSQDRHHSPRFQQGLRRLAPYLLGTAAAVVCAARLYSVVSVVAPVAMEIEEPEHRKVANDDAAVS